MIVAIVSYLIALSVLALVIGFSPILYGMMIRLSAERNNSNAGVWLVAGVVAGIVCMFALGGSAALAIDSLRAHIGGEDGVRYAFLGVVGLLGIVYVVRQSTVKHSSKSPLKRKAKTTMQNVPLFLFAALRTLTSVSGLAAVVVISGAIASHTIPWIVAFAILLPFVCVVAVTPFLVLARGSEWQVAGYTYIAMQGTRALAFVRVHEPVFRAAALLICIVLVLYAIVGLLT